MCLVMVRYRLCRYFNLQRVFFIGVIGFVLTILVKVPFPGKSAWQRMAVAQVSVLRNFQHDVSTIMTSVNSSTTKSEICDLPGLIVDGLPWPDCLVKVHWLKTNIDVDSCYKDNGLVPNDVCSILMYLSTQERHCPLLEQAELQFPLYYEGEQSIPRYDFRGLYQQLKKYADYSWILHRISNMETMWLQSATQLFSVQSHLRKKRIHIHLGLMKLGLGKEAWQGGPLGELVQWSDVIASLYVLGHDIVISSQPGEIIPLYKRYKNMFGSLCTPKSIYKKGNIPFDIIFTDITGYKLMREKIGSKAFESIRCRLRIVDSFGTEAVFNHPPYRTQLGLPTSPYSGLDLKLQQFNTMFPHTPDNTFLGFVTEFRHNVSSINITTNVSKKNIALVYGKSESFWKGKEDYLRIVQEYVEEVHATVADATNLPSFITNHGIVNRAELGELLQRTKIFIGLGFPFEGPAPLEAVQYGAVFLNPKFTTPVSSRNHKFYEKKPTRRKITSQNPYAEKLIGEPYVYTVDIENEKDLRRVLHQITEADDLNGYLRHEFSALGMLERLGMQIEKQDFCIEIPYERAHSHQQEKMRWPPLEALHRVSSFTEKSESCNEVCDSVGLICEPSFFPVINRIEGFQKSNRYFPCNDTDIPESQDSDHPSFDEKTGKCYLQNNPQLFSCAGNNQNNYRLCPCRDYVHEQIALCKNCGSVRTRQSSLDGRAESLSATRNNKTI